MTLDLSRITKSSVTYAVIILISHLIFVNATVPQLPYSSSLSASGVYCWASTPPTCLCGATSLCALGSAITGVAALNSGSGSSVNGNITLLVLPFDSTFSASIREEAGTQVANYLASLPSGSTTVWALEHCRNNSVFANAAVLTYTSTAALLVSARNITVASLCSDQPVLLSRTLDSATASAAVSSGAAATTYDLACNVMQLQGSYIYFRQIQLNNTACVQSLQTLYGYPSLQTMWAMPLVNISSVLNPITTHIGVSLFTNYTHLHFYSVLFTTPSVALYASGPAGMLSGVDVTGLYVDRNSTMSGCQTYGALMQYVYGHDITLDYASGTGACNVLMYQSVASAFSTQCNTTAYMLLYNSTLEAQYDFVYNATYASPALTPINIGLTQTLVWSNCLGAQWQAFGESCFYDNIATAVSSGNASSTDTTTIIIICVAFGVVVVILIAVIACTYRSGHRTQQHTVATLMNARIRTHHTITKGPGSQPDQIHIRTLKSQSLKRTSNEIRAAARSSATSLIVSAMTTASATETTTPSLIDTPPSVDSTIATTPITPVSVNSTNDMPAQRKEGGLLPPPPSSLTTAPTTQSTTPLPMPLLLHSSVPAPAPAPATTQSAIHPSSTSTSVAAAAAMTATATGMTGKQTIQSMSGKPSKTAESVPLLSSQGLNMKDDGRAVATAPTVAGSIAAAAAAVGATSVVPPDSVKKSNMHATAIATSTPAVAAATAAVPIVQAKQPPSVRVQYTGSK